jgi:hypothetical protein
MTEKYLIGEHSDTQRRLQTNRRAMRRDFTRRLEAERKSYGIHDEAYFHAGTASLCSVRKACNMVTVEVPHAFVTVRR